MISTKKAGLPNLSESISLPIDVFICSSSFEERCRSIADRVNPGLAIIFYNEDQLNIVGKNKDYLMQRFQGKAKEIALRTNDPLYIADSVVQNLHQIRSSLTDPITILVDITTFTHEALLIILRVLFTIIIHERDQIQLIYTSAQDYSSNEHDKSKKWLSRGVGEIRSVLGYAGELIPTQKNHLIILVGFEVDRALKLIESYEPSLVSLGVGHEEYSIHTSHQKVNKDKHEIINESIKGIYADVHSFDFSLIDPLQTKAQIEEQILMHSGYNVIIAPLNNKISTIGAALLANERPEIQLCYATANQYNIDYYSTPSEECYIMSYISSDT